MAGRPLKCGRYLAGLLLTCSLVFLLTRVSHADTIIDEHWQGSWWNNWSYSGIWADSLGLHGNGTAFYSGSLPSDHSIELRMSCSPSYSSAFYAYVRHSDSWYEADVDTSHWLGLYAYDASANEGAGGYYTMGTAYVSYLSCSQPLRLTAHGSDISVVSAGQRVIGGDDYLASSGTAGVYVWTTGATTALTEAIIRGADNTPPTAPSLAAHGAWYRIDLSWSPSVDADSGVWYYAVYRNSVHCGSVNAPTTSFSDTAVQPGNTYWYTVRATDNEWNTSALSNAVAVTLISVAVYPQYVTMGASQSVQFAAAVTGNPNTDVTWSMSPSVGSLSANGLYTAPSLIGSSQTVAIRATSVADPNNWNTATVTLLPVSVTVTPSSASLAALQTRQFTATVQYTSNTAVTWTRSPSVGTISSSGLYTAPALIASAQTVTVTATSNADPSKSAGATITLLPISVTVSPSSITLAANQGQQFTAYVANTTNTAVIWTMSPSLGTLSPSGLYTAPASFTPPQTVAIMATSVADPTKASIATVTLQPPQPILDERWQSNWQSRWNSSGVWADPLGLHGNGTAFYAANLPADYSVELRTNCTSASSSYFYAYARYNDSYGYRAWYEADIGSGGWVGAYAYDSTANEGEGAWFTLGTASVGYPSCSQPLRLTAHGSSIIVTSGGQRVIAADDSAITGGTAGVEVHVPANEPQTALTELLIWPADNTAPPVPANLTAHGIGNRIGLAWSPSVDAESGLCYYLIYRNSVPCGSVNAPTTSFSDTAVQPGYMYWYTVRATDNEFNTSAPSNATSLTFISVILSPGAPSLAALQTQQFTATVTGNTNTAVTWSLEPSVGTGSVSSNGLYTAPALIPSAQWVTIRATSAANPSNSGTAAAYLMPLSVTVTPATATLSATQTRQFTATVANAQNLSTAVAWSVASGEGTINSSGLYTAPNLVHSPGPGPVTIRATSLADPSKWGTATVTLMPVTVAVDPASVTLAAYQSRQFSAYAAYDPLSAGVTWSLNPEVGVLWPNRVYTAPATFTSPQTVRITATSVTDPTRSNTATVTLQDPAAIIDEKWQGNWRNNWSYSGNLTSDSLGLHGIGTVLYAGSVPDDQSIELRPVCTGAQGTSFTAYLRYGDPTSHYKASIDQASPGSIAIIRVNGGDYHALGVGFVSAAPATCSRPVRLNANGTGISLVWGSQPLIGTEDSALTSGTAGASITTADATAALAEAIIRGPDTTPPPAPAGLMAEGVANRIDVAWTASVDSESGTWGHAVFRDGVFLAWSQTPSSHSDVAVQPGSTHSYWVTAYDNVANGSQPSNTAVVTVTSQPAVSISISPSTAVSLWQGQSQQFTATVTNASNVTANWYVDDVLQPGGPSATWTYTAPASIMTYQIVTIKAVSVADPMRWASTTITLQPPTAVAIFLDPMTADLTVSGQQQFNAWVTGTTNVAVSWALSGPGQLLNCGTPFCTYQAPSSIPSLTSATLTATSVADQSKSRTATITLRPSPGISMTPARATMTASQSRLIRADVSGVTDTRATWTLSGPGSLQGCTQPSTTCTYRAPDTISSSQPTATITATSLVDPNKSASATVTLQKTFLEVNLAYVPIDLYQAPNSQPDKPNLPDPRIWANSKCLVTDTIRTCVAKMFNTDPDNFVGQGVRGVRFFLGINGPMYSTPFLLDRNNGSYLDIRPEWRANLRQFFADLAQFGITHVTPTIQLMGDVMNCASSGCVPGNKTIESSCIVRPAELITAATSSAGPSGTQIVTLTSAGHGLVTGSPIRISGFAASEGWESVNTPTSAQWTTVTEKIDDNTFTVTIKRESALGQWSGTPVLFAPCTSPVTSSACGRTAEPVAFIKTAPFALDARSGAPAMQGHNDAYNCANAGCTDSGITGWGTRAPNDYKFWGWTPFISAVDEVLAAAQVNGLQVEDFDIQQELNLAEFTLAGRLLWDNKHAIDGTVVSNVMDGTDVYIEIRNRMVAHGFNPRRASFSTTVGSPHVAADLVNPDPGDFCPSVYGDSAMILHESELTSAFAGGVIGWPSFSTVNRINLVCGGQTGQQLPEPGSMIALPSSWQQPEVTNIHAYVCNTFTDPDTGEVKCGNPPSGNSDFTPRVFYNELTTYLNRQQKTADRVVFGEVFPADGSCVTTDAAWATQNFNGFAESSLKQRSANAGTVFRLWTNPGEACWGVPSRTNPPYDPYR